MVLDVGDGISHASAICEGFSINNATRRIDLGGKDITDHLVQLLQRSGYSIHTSAEYQIVRSIKEKHCYVDSDDKKFDNEFGGVSKFKLEKSKIGGMGTSQRRIDTD